MHESELEQMLDVVRTFVRKKAVPLEPVVERDDSGPADLTAEMKKMGLFGYAIPEEYGGLGLTALQQARVTSELSWSSAAKGFSTNNGLAGGVLKDGGTEEQKKTWLPLMASGAVVASFALTESGAGSDPSAMTTSARRDGDGWVIDGSKSYITNAPVADLFMLFARTNPDKPGNRGISAFLIPANTQGLVVGAKDDKMGLRGSPTANVYFTDVRVPNDAVVGGDDGIGQGFVVAAKSLARGRMTIAAHSVGMAARLVREATEYAKAREQGGGPIARFQLVQGLVADAITDYYAGRALLMATARSYDDATDMRRGPAVAKYFCSEMLGRVADRAVQIYGGAGYLRGSAVERMYRDARVARIYDGTSQVLQVMIARDALGKAARA